jgi:hypothetical protein
MQSDGRNEERFPNPFNGCFSGSNPALTAKKQHMENVFKIAKWGHTESDGFAHLGYDVYKITYHKGKKSHQIRIVVDGIITNRVINLIDGNSGYKTQILSAISDVKNAKIDLTQKQSEKKKVTLGYIETFYNQLIVNNVKSYLVGISKEESRDVLTKFQLIS